MVEIAATFDKRTTGRARHLAVSTPLRAGLRLASRLAPELSAELGRRLFFTPPRSRRRAEQSAVLARGRRFVVETREGRVAGWSWGHGEPVLLLHGWGGHAGQMTPFVDALVARRLRAIAIDLPAHGETSGRHASARHFAGAILDAADLLGPLAGVVAHSLGAAAATLAFDWGLHARAAVFVAPPARFGAFFERAAESFGLSEAARRRLEDRAERWVGMRFDEIEPRRLARHQDARLLVVHDRGDEEVLHHEGEELARLWPGARLRSTVGLGHYRILRDHAVIAAAAEFLAARDEAVA